MKGNHGKCLGFCYWHGDCKGELTHGNKKVMILNMYHSFNILNQIASEMGAFGSGNNWNYIVSQPFKWNTDSFQ